MKLRIKICKSDAPVEVETYDVPDGTEVVEVVMSTFVKRGFLETTLGASLEQRFIGSFPGGLTAEDLKR